MNKQEIFDKVVTHLLTQKKKALSKDGKCVYLNEDGFKCAIGCLIPDGHPAQYCDGGIQSIISYSDISELFGIRSMYWLDTPFLKQLQLIHDTCDVVEWYSQLHGMAVKYDLKFNAPPVAQ